MPDYETLLDRIPNTLFCLHLVLALALTAGAMRYSRSSMLDVSMRENLLQLLDQKDYLSGE